MVTNNYTWITLYLVVFTGHFLYAYFLGKSSPESLFTFNINKLLDILIGLSLLNLISISVFIIPSPLWGQVNLLLHILLFYDEVIRCQRHGKRWPFALNHILFTLLIMQYLH